MDPLFTPSHHGGSGEPLVCIHGFTDTWRTWELVLPALESCHEVLAPTLAGHAGGPALEAPLTYATLVDGVERAMDEAGFASAHILGNSLGGYIALALAARARARSLVLLAPAGGWDATEQAARRALEHFAQTQELVRAAIPRLDEILASDRGRRAATRWITCNYEHIPVELIAHQVHGVARCDAVAPLIELALAAGWPTQPAPNTCPVRVIWGCEDAVLPWPAAARRYREQWLSQAEWIELPGVGHLPQLDVPERTATLTLEFTCALHAGSRES